MGQQICDIQKLGYVKEQIRGFSKIGEKIGENYCLFNYLKHEIKLCETPTLL